MTRQMDVAIAQKVAKVFDDIIIMDVGFSPAVTKAATKQLVNGKPMIEIAKSNTAVEGNKPLMLDTNALAMKMAMGQGVSLADLEKIAKDVNKGRTAVCDSCACTMMYYCRENGFEGALEWIAIRYKNEKGQYSMAGHSIVVGHRAGQVTDPSSWGSDAIIMDLWYWRLGMRDQAIWSDKDELASYRKADLDPYAEGLQVKASIGDVTGLTGKAKRTSATGKRCLLATAAITSRGLSDDCEELEILRTFRDTVMLASPRGRAAVERYYAAVPAFLDRVHQRPDAAELLEAVYTRTVLPAVAAIRQGQHDLAEALFLDLLTSVERAG